MPRGSVRLGAINVTGFKHALHSGHRMLFVKLRTLREIGRAIEILDREQVGATLSRARDNLRGKNFGESASPQGRPKLLGQRRLDPENRAATIGAKCERAAIDREVGRDFLEA